MQPNLLISEHLDDWPLVGHYHPMDTKEQYEINAVNPEFRLLWPEDSVTYTTNKFHYRCAEWADVDWSSSVLVLGCSFTFGVGLDDSQTITHQLSKLIDMPVVNLGQGGASWTFIWVNTIRLLAAGIKPKAVIYIWPNTNRYCRLFKDSRARSYGPWNIDIEDNGLGREYALAELHAQLLSGDLLTSIRALWTCPQLHYYYSPYDRQLTQWAVRPLKPMVDKARDQVHPGVITTGLWANQLAKDLTAKIVK